MSLYAKLTDLPDGHAQQKDEFDRRYQGTHLLQTVGNTRRTLYVIGRDGRFIHTRLDNEETFLIDGTTPQPEIDVFLPQVGYYNKQGTAFYLVKRPSRQWRRSFCAGIYAIQGIPYEPRQGITQFAECIAQQQYAKLDEIINPLFANVAINSKYAIRTNAQNRSTLLYKQYEIGFLDFQKKEVILQQPSLLQEVRDLFKYTGTEKWKLNATTIG